MNVSFQVKDRSGLILLMKALKLGLKTQGLQVGPTPSLYMSLSPSLSISLLSLSPSLSPFFSPSLSLFLSLPFSTTLGLLLKSLFTQYSFPMFIVYLYLLVVCIYKYLACFCLTFSLFLFRACFPPIFSTGTGKTRRDSSRSSSKF